MGSKRKPKRQLKIASKIGQKAHKKEESRDASELQGTGKSFSEPAEIEA